MGEICSCRSLQKSDNERFAQVAHDKRVTGAIHTFSQANQSFALSLTKKSDSLEKNYEHIPNPALRS